MKKKILIILLMTATLLLGGIATLSAAQNVKNSGVGVKIEIPEEMLTFLDDNGIDVAELTDGMDVPASVRKAILTLNRDSDARTALNAIVNKALREARETTGKPAYIEVGPLYWGYWFSGDI